MSLQEKMSADKIFYNGTIYSMDALNSTFAAIAIRDGRIIAMAKSEDEKEFIEKFSDQRKTSLLDLKEKVVLPGMFDTHLHAPGLAYDILFNVNLYNAKSMEETLQLIEDYIKQNPDNEIYYGRGVNSSFFSEEEKIYGPRKEHLDRLSNKPIIIADFGGNFLWLNTAAFNKYSITVKTLPPKGGEIVIDEKSNSLWGVIRGEARALIPYQELTKKQSYEAAKWFQNIMISYGYTSIFALRPPGTVEPRTTLFSIFKELEKNNELFLHVQGGKDMDPNGDIDEQIKYMNKLKEEVDSDLIQFTTAKFFLDGTVEGVDAFLREPYSEAAGKEKSFKGLFMWDKDKLRYAFQEVMKAGFQIHCHSIGDGASEVALKVLEEAYKALPKKDYRTVIAHLQLIHPSDIKKMKELGVIANVQPYWHFKSPIMFNPVEKVFLGQDRGENEYPLKSFFKEGVTVSSSSDYPVTPEPNPFHGIRAGVTRNIYNESSFKVEPLRDINDERYLLNKTERASVEEMIRSFTINSAFSMFHEDDLGSLEKGKIADFIIINQDPFKIDPLRLEDTFVEKTYFAGKKVFER